MINKKKSPRRHYIEERNSPCSMGVQRRVITTDKIKGPWVEGNTAAAWKAYKYIRKHAEPYIIIVKTQVTEEINYNPNYGDERICECGHPYYRHFDTYEDMKPIGCKYCNCFKFKEKK